MAGLGDVSGLVQLLAHSPTSPEESALMAALRYVFVAARPPPHSPTSQVEWAPMAGLGALSRASWAVSLPAVAPAVSHASSAVDAVWVSFALTPH